MPETVDAFAFPKDRRPVLDDEVDYYLPIPEAPGFLVSRDGEIIDQSGHPAGSLVNSPWGDLEIKLVVEGTAQIRTTQEWAALAWRVETRRQRAMRLRMEALRRRVAAAEALVMKRPGATSQALCGVSE